MNAKEEIINKKEMLLEELEAYESFSELCKDVLQFDSDKVSRLDSRMIKAFLKELTKIDNNLVNCYKEIRFLNLNSKSLKNLIGFIDSVINYKEDRVEDLNQELMAIDHAIFPDLFKNPYTDKEYLQNKEIAKTHKTSIYEKYSENLDQQ